ncbi:cytochrome P450 71A1-like isoform X2 [Asparagus officinalis]|uniref:cytochrome P450 71A1-like isoform X2 n=1 Tax=Asparagus officinalis TaxID=4686 RepID=UPI00098E3816|nr:cytochrome P450 71A1-like isoform X2 [Asparagus officinalis]
MSLPILSPSFLLPFLLLAPFLLLLSHYRPSTSKRDFPPSPSRLPIIGNLHQLTGSLPHRSLASLSNKHGPLMLLHLGQIRTLIISSPEILQEVVETQDAIFSGRPSLVVANKLLYGSKDVAFAPPGDYWRNMKSLIVSHLVSPQRIQSYCLLREQAVASMIDNIMKLSSLGPQMNLSDPITIFAKEVFSAIVFNKRSREEGWNEVADVLIKESNDLLGSFHFGDYFPRLSWLSTLSGFDARLERTFSKVDKILEQIIEDRRSGDSKSINHGSELDSFVDILLSLQKDSKTGSLLDEESIKAFVGDTFGGGTIVTALILEWAMAELVRTPEAMKKLQKELRSKVGVKIIMKNEDLVAMTYLKSVIKEALRLHTPSPFLVPREVIQNTRVQGYEIPKQTRVTLI